jgi:hypothetical protein
MYVGRLRFARNSSQHAAPKDWRATRYESQGCRPMAGYAARSSCEQSRNRTVSDVPRIHMRDEGGGRAGEESHPGHTDYRGPSVRRGGARFRKAGGRVRIETTSGWPRRQIDEYDVDRTSRIIAAASSCGARSVPCCAAMVVLQPIPGTAHPGPRPRRSRRACARGPGNERHSAAIRTRWRGARDPWRRQVREPAVESPIPFAAEFRRTLRRHPARSNAPQRRAIA